MYLFEEFRYLYPVNEPLNFLFHEIRIFLKKDKRRVNGIFFLFIRHYKTIVILRSRFLLRYRVQRAWHILCHSHMMR